MSRVSPSGRTEIEGLDVPIHDLTLMSHVQVEAIQKATREDQVLQMLMQQMMQGWPDHIKLLSVALKPFWQLKDDLSTDHSCIAFQGRFYIPSVLRAKLSESSPSRAPRYCENETQGTDKHVLVRFE